MIGLFSRVYSQVTFQCLQMAETSATDLAWIWLLSGMNQNVSPKVSNLCKEIMLALQISFFISAQLTGTQSTHLHKSSAAGLTLVWLFSWVNSCVGFEVSWSVELSPADIASIRFLSCSTNERRLSKTLQVAAKMTFVAAAVYFYRCELFCDWQGFPCSGMLLGNGHICMACRCGPEACGVSRLPPLQTWSRIHYRSMFHFL